MPLPEKRREEMLRNLKEVKVRIKVARTEINMAKRAGLDVKSQEEQLNLLDQTARGIDRVYGPS